MIMFIFSRFIKFKFSCYILLEKITMVYVQVNEQSNWTMMQ